MSFQAQSTKGNFFFKNRLLYYLVRTYLQNVPLFSLALAIIDGKVNHLLFRHWHISKGVHLGSAPSACVLSDLMHQSLEASNILKNLALKPRNHIVHCHSLTLMGALAYICKKIQWGITKKLLFGWVTEIWNTN